MRELLLETELFS